MIHSTCSSKYVTMKLIELLRGICEDDAVGAASRRLPAQYNADTGTYTRTLNARGLQIPTHISPPDPSISYNADMGVYTQTLNARGQPAPAPAPAQPLTSVDLSRFGITDNDFRSMPAPVQHALAPGYVPRPAIQTGSPSQLPQNLLPGSPPAMNGPAPAPPSPLGENRQPRGRRR